MKLFTVINCIASFVLKLHNIQNFLILFYLSNSYGPIYASGLLCFIIIVWEMNGLYGSEEAISEAGPLSAVWGRQNKKTIIMCSKEYFLQLWCLLFVFVCGMKVVLIFIWSRWLRPRHNLYELEELRNILCLHSLGKIFVSVFPTAAGSAKHMACLLPLSSSTDLLASDPIT